MEEEKQFYPPSKGIWNIPSIATTQWVQISTPSFWTKLSFKTQIPCLSLPQLPPRSYMLPDNYYIVLLTRSRKKSYHKPRNRYWHFSFPASAPKPGVQDLVLVFATFPETEPVQMHFSGDLCQLSPHRITELIFVVNTFPARCLKTNLTTHRKMCAILCKTTTVNMCTKYNNKQNNVLGTITPNVMCHRLTCLIHDDYFNYIDTGPYRHVGVPNGHKAHI